MSLLVRFLGVEGVELYNKAKHLSENESKNDPQDEPFRSKYQARELFKDLRSLIKEKLDVSLSNNEVENEQTIHLLLLCVDYLLGQTFIDTEETSEGEEWLTNVIKTIADGNVKHCISLHVNVLNSLGILASGRGNVSECMNYFIQADKIYQDWKQNPNHEAPFSFLENLEDFVGSEDEITKQRTVSFESAHTHTLYYLAQVYAKQGKSNISAHYCHMTLHRQLKQGDFNPIDWGLNAATLSQYYLSSEKYPEARHCLSSGSLILKSAVKEEGLSEEEKELQDQRLADLDRCWIKYGLALLETSMEQMLSEVNNDDLDANKKDNINDSSNEENCETNFEEFNLDLSSYEDSITDKLVRTFSEAQKIFLFVAERVKSAQQFYTLDTHASDGVELIQDHSKLFKLSAFFELDMQRQCCMHKRRVDMLSKVLNELNPKYYLLVCRQLMYELAETFSSMADIKTAMIEMENTRISPHATSKINKLILQSISQYQAYIDSLKDNKPDLPKEFPEGDVRPALVAFFCMGRLYSKILEPDVSRRLCMMKKSSDCYQFVVDYCSTNPDSKTLVPNELNICEEMVKLMPLKMERIKQQS